MIEGSQIRTFVVKVASRCNLACSYCYMYEHADQGWRRQPKFMSRETVDRLAFRLREHADRVNARELLVVAHGGEPLLNPDLDYFFGALTLAMRPRKARFAIQTNGTLLDEGVIQILLKHRVQVGVSLDGPAHINDKVRLTVNGGGSFESVLSGINRLRARAPQLLASVLQVINPLTDPVDAIKFLESLEIPRADLLFPDLNHTSIASARVAPGELGNWLVQAFDYWCERGQTIQIRLFEVIAALLWGVGRGTDLLGAEAPGTVMIETDGSYEVHDGLKTTFDGAGRTGMSLAVNAISELGRLPLVRAFQDKSSAACSQCLSCELFSICGGGSPIHRYKDGIGFVMPSVYCADLDKIIRHIATRLAPLRTLHGEFANRDLSQSMNASRSGMPLD